MPRLEDLSELQRKNILFFPCLESDTVPFTPMKKELSRSKVALVTSAGLHLRDDVPFGRGDTSFRVIPSGTKASEILQSHSSMQAELFIEQLRLEDLSLDVQILEFPKL